MYEKEKCLLMSHGCAAAGGSLAVRRAGPELTWAAWPHRNQVCLLRIDGDQAEARTVSGRPTDGDHNVIQVGTPTGRVVKVGTRA